MDDDDKLMCGGRKCGWAGLGSELVRVTTFRHLKIKVFDFTCPKCGGRIFYVTGRSKSCAMSASGGGS